MPTYRAWSIFWLIWLGASFGVFLVAEIFGLVTDKNRTLSEAIWRWEKFDPAQPITHWTAFHFLFIGIFLVLVLWLCGHFAFGWWR